MIECAPIAPPVGLNLFLIRAVAAFPGLALLIPFG